MRKMRKTLGIAGLALAIGLVLTGCDTATSPSGDPTPTSGGKTAYSGTIENYSGDGVIHAMYADGFGNYSYFEIKENIGTVSGGKFSFDLKGIPIITANLGPLENLFGEDNIERFGVSFSDGNAKIMVAKAFVVKPGDSSGGYSLEFHTGPEGYNGRDKSGQESLFIYSDRSVTIRNSDGKYDLTFQKGWNTMYIQHGDSYCNRSTPFPGSAWYLYDESWAEAYMP